MRRRQLDPRRAYKPLDVGNGIVSGSLTPGGRWLSLGIAHPVHGRVELTSMAAFSGDLFDQRAVRAYRAALADPARPSFGFDLLDEEANSVELELESFPHAVVERPQGRFEVKTVAPAGRRGAVQLLRVKARKHLGGLTWGGALRLARAEYTQLTPGGPLPPAPASNRSGFEDHVLWIDDRVLDAAAAIAQWPAMPIDEDSEATVALAAAFAFDREAAIREARELAEHAEELLDEARDERARLWAGIGRAPERSLLHGLSYALDCAACRTDGALAILADHQILPLVWTRDAYYVCRALLALSRPESKAVVEGFVRWMFEVAERVDGWWPRASLATGRAKDPVFQLDQQLWPLLLVADHARVTGDRSLRGRYAARCAETIEALLAKRTAFGLIATAESAADDPPVEPFHFSSHVLMWRVLDAFGHAAAPEAREATLGNFACDGRFAYAIADADGGGARHYHDANDFPTIFAPGWGFCSADDPRWRATIEFAWSDANEAYFSGPLAGLGSRHTPHPWPLGDLQEVVVARVTRDATRERSARERLERVETWDGMLPEAYDERTGAVASRHWFAWPAALRALLELDPMLTAP